MTGSPLPVLRLLEIQSQDTVKIFSPLTSSIITFPWKIDRIYELWKHYLPVWLQSRRVSSKLTGQFPFQALDLCRIWEIGIREMSNLKKPNMKANCFFWATPERYHSLLASIGHQEVCRMCFRFGEEVRVDDYALVPAIPSHPMHLETEEERYHTYDHGNCTCCLPILIRNAIKIPQ